MGMVALRRVHGRGQAAQGVGRLEACALPENVQTRKHRRLPFGRRAEHIQRVPRAGKGDVEQVQAFSGLPGQVFIIGAAQCFLVAHHHAQALTLRAQGLVRSGNVQCGKGDENHRRLKPL